MSIGALLATLLSIFQEKLASRMGKMSSTPEGRLYFACVESILMPIGLFWFGWTSYPSVPWIVPSLALACATMGIFSIYLATFNYLADTYHRYESSAIAAQSFCMFMLFHPVLLTELTGKQAGISWEVSFHWWRMPCSRLPGCFKFAGRNCKPPCQQSIYCLSLMRK